MEQNHRIIYKLCFSSGLQQTGTECKYTKRLYVKDAKILSKMDMAGAGTGREGQNPGGGEGQKIAASPVPLTAMSSSHSPE